MENRVKKAKNVIMDWVKDPLYVPMKEKELAIFMQVEPQDRPILKQALEELLAESKLSINKRGKYSVAKEKIIRGTFIGNKKGFGFIEVEGLTEDYFVPEEYVNDAFHEDIVEAVLVPATRGKRQEAKVINIVEHGITTMVGTFEASANFGFVIPDNQKIAEDIFIPGPWTKKAVSGHKVVVEITDYGNKFNRRRPEGKVIEILGHANDPGVDIISVVRAFGLPMEFTEEVLNQAERVAKPVSEADCNGRRDLRQLRMVTIDGEDAKDLDDAVSLEKDGEDYLLGVHIADVTNYVQERSALDKEALKRGTSVYLTDRVIPMLPHTLSNGICSLNANEDRLALSCLMKIDKSGKVIDHDICESVICVDRRMSYTEVNRILTQKSEEDVKEYGELCDMFELMGELSLILQAVRQKRGAIDFDFPEAKIKLTPEGKPVEVYPYERNAATKLIEDFMLLANETVAEHYYWLETPFVYRIHENPDLEKIQQLTGTIANLGYSMKVSGDEIHPKEIQKLLNRTKGTKEEALIGRMALRSMKQAKYSTECVGHFGLACEYYCHFTSPIRRYPDLQIHRIIKESIRGRMKDNRISHYQEILPLVAYQTSKLERRAEDAERETVKIKMAQYMEERIGEVFEGHISGVTSWGIYVELPNTIEGMIRVEYLTDQFYNYNEAKCELVGVRNKKTYQLGQELRVVVKYVDPVLHTIDFDLADE